MVNFSKTKSSIKEIWLVSLRSYRKVLNEVWFSAFALGFTMVAVLWINRVLGINNLITKVVSVILPALIIFVVVYFTSLLMYQAYNIFTDKKASLMESIKFINTRYFKLAGTMIIVMILYMIGLMVLVLPGIFVFVVFSMAQPLVLFDEKPILGSLKGSFKLVWGNWWRSFAIIFPLITLNYLMLYVVTVASNDNRWLLIIASTMVTFLYYPFFYGCILHLFNDLKLRKEEEGASIIVT